MLARSDRSYPGTNLRPDSPGPPAPFLARSICRRLLEGIRYSCRLLTLALNLERLLLIFGTDDVIVGAVLNPFCFMVV